ncbi:MAG: hypothetical protein QM731_04350 [Chitinophagaceae bacterium]
MASIGKKILSAFMEVSDDSKPVTEKPAVTNITSSPVAATYSNTPPADVSGKFRDYFDRLFKEANIPGPDYFEFSKMIEAMQGIADEKARYSAAFAGLQVQGLDKQKLLSTAAEYQQVLDTDAKNFLSTVSVALEEKVQAKKNEISNAAGRIQQLSQEIIDLQQQIVLLENEVKENEQKIESNTGGYKAALAVMKNRIEHDVEKIKQYIV